MKNHPLKKYIKDSFLQGTEAAELVAAFGNIIAKSTIYNWIKIEKWEDERAVREKQMAKSPEILLKMLNDMIAALPENITKPSEFVKLSDAIVKVCKAIKMLLKNHDRLAQIVFAVIEMGAFLNENIELYDADFREKFVAFLKHFQNKAIEKFSPKNYVG